MSLLAQKVSGLNLTKIHTLIAKCVFTIMEFSLFQLEIQIGLAQSDQWDSKKVGTYSIAIGRNTIASGFNATTFGISTKASAWYTTTFGQGTEANSRSEMVIGSYNSLKQV